MPGIQIPITKEKHSQVLIRIQNTDLLDNSVTIFVVIIHEPEELV